MSSHARFPLRPVAAALVAVVAVCAQEGFEPVFSDSFEAYDEARKPLQTAWQIDGGEWTAADGVLSGRAGDNAMAIPLDAPEQDAPLLRAAFRVRRRLSPDGWAVAALLIHQDRANFWQLALVEGPGPRHDRYVEIADMSQGRWKGCMQIDGSVTVASTRQPGFAWQYGELYQLELALAQDRISGTVKGADGEAVLWSQTLELGHSESPRGGRCAIRLSGFHAEVADIAALEPPGAGIDPALRDRLARGPLGRAVVLDDTFMSTSADTVETYAGALRRTGFGVTRLDARALAEPGLLNPAVIDLLVLIDAVAVPVSLHRPISRYLRSGGDLAAFGGVPFSTAMVHTDHGWQPRAHILDQLGRLPPANLIVPLDHDDQIRDWTRNSGQPDAGTSWSIGHDHEAERPVLRVDVRGLQDWDTLRTPRLESPFPAGHTLTCFRAKGDAHTPDLAVEWREQDGSRWIAVVPLTESWRPYALQPDAFTYWADEDPETGPDRSQTTFMPTHASSLSFGLAFSHTRKLRGDHTYWIADVGTAPLPADVPDLAEAVQAPALEAFSDAYPWMSLQGVRAATPPPAQLWLPADARVAWTGNGRAVLGFPKPGEARLLPLLVGASTYGKTPVNLLAAVRHCAGPYRGGDWLLCGGKPDAGFDHGTFADLAAAAAAGLTTDTYLTAATTERYSAAPGDTVGVEWSCVSFGRTPLATMFLSVELLPPPAARPDLRQLLGDQPEARRAIASLRTDLEVVPRLPESGRRDLRIPPGCRPGTATIRLTLHDDAGPVDVLELDLHIRPQNAPLSRCQGPIRLSDDGTHLVTAAGDRFFCIGANYAGALDTHGRFWEDRHFSPRLLEVQLKRSADAGLNCWRFCGWCGSGPLTDDILSGRFAKIDALLTLADQYGIHLLITPPGTQFSDMSRRLEVFTALARHLQGHPAVLGYDLQNEPGISRLCGVRFPEDTPNPVQAFDFFQHYADRLEPMRSRLEQYAREKRWGTRRFDPGLTYRQALNVVCANALYGQWRQAYDITFSTFPQMAQALPPDDAWRPAVEAIDAGLETWVELQRKALIEADPTHLVTVGYNQVLSCFPGNRRLDFVSQHVYQRPYTYEDVRTNLTTLDRLRTVWPGKPITFGEFGYSSGIRMPDGDRLDVYAAAVGEMCHWLYALAHDFDGCMKWVVNDHPLPYMHHFNNWAGRGLDVQTYEARFGLLAFDGTERGRLKPVAHALAFLRDYVGRVGAAAGGTLQTAPAQDRETAAGGPVTYAFRGDRALFLGGLNGATEGLSFTARQPTNLLLDWGAGALRIRSSAAASVTLDTTTFLGDHGGGPLRVRGTMNRLRMHGRKVHIDLIEGADVVIGP